MPIRHGDKEPSLIFVVQAQQKGFDTAANVFDKERCASPNHETTSEFLNALLCLRIKHG
jgi:hypothetical protein